MLHFLMDTVAGKLLPIHQICIVLCVDISIFRSSVDEMIFNADFFLFDMDAQLFDDMFGRVVQLYNVSQLSFYLS